MAIITLAYRAEAIFQQQGPDQRRSGYLVPAVDGKAVKAATFSTIKWPHLTGYAPVHIVRCSIGRAGEVAILQRDDDDLAALAAAELGEAIGVTAAPVATRVTRWGGALPQYTVGHAGRIARIRADVARQPGLAVAGAAYEGVGIPACVATARSATGQILTYLSGLYDENHGRRGDATQGSGTE
jgi:protoporphyrinogen/coproporphyrinogen III oxidase